MSILQNFYTITDQPVALAPEVNYQITIQKEHPIFGGHFPGNPVTPGVCMLQIIKELSELQLSKKLILSKAKNIKFMAIINPEIQANVQVGLSIEEDSEHIFQVKSTFSYLNPENNEQVVALKFSGVFTENQ